MGWKDDAIVEDSGTGIALPTQRGMQVSPADQKLRDQARLNLLEKEKIQNPNDPALAQELAGERKKQGIAAPSKSWQQDEVVTQSKKSNEVPQDRTYLGETMRQLGLTGRNAMEAVGVVPMIVGNAAEALGVKGAGGNVGTTIADKMGLPRREGGVEEFVGDLYKTAVPASAGAKVASLVPVAGKGLVKAISRHALTGAGAGAGASAALEQNPVEGAMTGAIAGPVIAGAGRALRPVVNTVTKWGQQVAAGAQGRAAEELQRSFGDRTQAAVSALRNLKPIVPGEMPTAGRAASTNIPELKVLEEMARTKPGAEKFLTRDAANEAARVRRLDQIAASGTPGAATQGGRIPLSPNEARRAARTDPLYAKAMPDRVTMTPELEELVAGIEARPAVVRGGRAFRQEQTNAIVGGGRVPAGPVPAVPGTPAMPEVRDSMGVLIKPAVPEVPGTPGNRSIQDLQQLQKALGKRSNMLSNANPEEAERLSVARKQLTQNMTEQSPAFAQANDTFRQFSQPQNQAEIAKVLVGALRNTSGVERPGAFLTARQNAAQTLKKADQSPRFQQIEQVMTPTQMRQINQVQRSVQREADYANLPTTRTMLPEYLSPMDQLEQATPGWFSRAITVARSQAKRIGKRSDEEVYKVVNEAMLNPSKMADLLETVPPTQRSAIINALRQGRANPTIKAQVVGMMTPDNQEQ